MHKRTGVQIDIDKLAEAFPGFPTFELDLARRLVECTDQCECIIASMHHATPEQLSLVQDILRAIEIAVVR